MNENKIPGAGGTGDAEGASYDKTDESLLTKKIAATLAEKFPAAFARPVPLKVGIFEDLLAATTIMREPLSAFLAAWVSDPAYLRKCRKVGAPRFNLDGLPEGIVSESEANYARLFLADPKMKTTHRPEETRKA